jgi:hypothetical protein
MVLVATCAVPVAARDMPVVIHKPDQPVAEREIFCDGTGRAAEAACLEKLADIAWRDGDWLRLKLANGKTKSYKSETQACLDNIVEECIIYRLAGFYPVHQMTLVYGVAYEGGGWVELVDRRTGSVLKLPGAPIFSPRGTRFVSAFCDGMGVDGCSFEIWSMTSDPPQREWLDTAFDKSFETWRDDSHFVLTMILWCDVSMPMCNGNYRTRVSSVDAVLVDGKWELRWPPKEQLGGTDVPARSP